jgi:hypothetical protein
MTSSTALADTRASVPSLASVLGQPVKPLQDEANGGSLEQMLYRSEGLHPGPPEFTSAPATLRRALRLRFEQASTAFWGCFLRFELARTDAATWTSASEHWFSRAGQPRLFEAPHVWAAESSSIGMTRSVWTIIRAVDEALASSGDERFEDGVETAFSRTVRVLVRASPDPVLGHLIRLVHHADRPSLLSEAVRWVGDLRDPVSHDQRRAFLEAALRSPASEIRDGAALGLSFLADPESLPALREAVARESLAELRADLETVVHDLQARKSGSI